MSTLIRSLGLNSSRRRQSGQLLPIAAVAFILMCGLAGLAIDSSRDYLMKRQAQNAVDFATLAAAKQMSLSGSLSAPLASNSNAVMVAHDFAANNGFPTIYSNGCDSSTGASFSATWFDVAGIGCNATAGFTNKVTVNSPPVPFASYPVPAACSGAGQYSCLQVVITAGLPQLFTNIFGIGNAYVTVAATAQVTLPASSFNAPPPNALVLYQPQVGCDTNDQQCFNESKPVVRTLLSCTGGANNCPTFWAKASADIYGFDGATLTPAGDETTLQSNGDMVVQARTTICDPYSGAVCSHNTVIGPEASRRPGEPSSIARNSAVGQRFSRPARQRARPTLRSSTQARPGSRRRSTGHQRLTPPA
jgi:Putative Flp pilus-assembly TadE/G-like